MFSQTSNVFNRYVTHIVFRNRVGVRQLSTNVSPQKDDRSTRSFWLTVGGIGGFGTLLYLRRDKLKEKMHDMDKSTIIALFSADFASLVVLGASYMAFRRFAPMHMQQRFDKRMKSVWSKVKF